MGENRNKQITETLIVQVKRSRTAAVALSIRFVRSAGSFYPRSYPTRVTQRIDILLTVPATYIFLGSCVTFLLDMLENHSLDRGRETTDDVTSSIAWSRSIRRSVFFIGCWPWPGAKKRTVHESHSARVIARLARFVRKLHRAYDFSSDWSTRSTRFSNFANFWQLLKRKKENRENSNETLNDLWI